VAPRHRGQGLGRALTLAGLHHLRHRGLASAMLYVDADNDAAIALYRSLDFAIWDSDTLFGR
jgi:mycothiol synthase